MPARNLPQQGEQFNSWTFLGEFKGRTWKCQCSCGSVLWPMSCHVRSGASTCCKACGTAKNKTHGLIGHPLYSTWTGVKTRCFKETRESWEGYGGRGITMEPSWELDFEAFLVGVGVRPTPEHTLDRINNDLGYTPGNVQWATPYEQARNRRDNRWITIGNETLVATDWCKRIGITFPCAFNRVKKMGWSWEKAVTTPSRNKIQYHT